MSVYVDHARLPFRTMLMSHLMADTSEELHEMTELLGLARWVQHPGTTNEHLDVSESKRQEAIRLGAHEVTGVDLVNLRRRKEGKPPMKLRGLSDEIAV